MEDSGNVSGRQGNKKPTVERSPGSSSAPVAADPIQRFSVRAGITKRRGYRASMQPKGLHINRDGAIALVSALKPDRQADAAILRGAIGGAVGGLFAGIVHSVNPDAPTTEVETPTNRGRVLYDVQNRELCFELPDGRWLDIVFGPKGKVDYFDRSLGLLKPLYGSRLIAERLGRRSPALYLAIGAAALILSILAAWLAMKSRTA